MYSHLADQYRLYINSFSATSVTDVISFGWSISIVYVNSFGITSVTDAFSFDQLIAIVYVNINRSISI